MPYITQKDREELKTRNPQNAGELNYSFYKTALNFDLNDEEYCAEVETFVLQYIEDKGECYQTYNDIVGALVGARKELKRRKGDKFEEYINILEIYLDDLYAIKIAPYEDKKIKINGDVT